MSDNDKANSALVDCSDKIRVLVLGASGNFGQRLLRLLALEPGLKLVAAARRLAPLKTLASEVQLTGTLAIDRDQLQAEQLMSLGIDILVDASGPFQTMRSNVIEAAIAAGVHYLDLADCRAFVSGISRFDKAAVAANIAVLSGASSTPALSHAVLDELCASWQRVDDISATISPSNRQAVGLAVVSAMLECAGKPIRVFEGGEWRKVRAWSGLRRFHSKDMGTRWASLVETPDLDLFVSRFHPANSARFEAALGLPIQHLALSALAIAVRTRLISTLAPLSRPLHWLVNAMNAFGEDKGVMEVRVKGFDKHGKPAEARWHLFATGESGPNVPVLAALAIVRRLRDKQLDFTGAASCAGLLSLSDFDADLDRLGIQREISRTDSGIAQRLGNARNLAQRETA